MRGVGWWVVGRVGLAIVGLIWPAHLRTDAVSRAAVMGFSGFFFAPVIMGVVSEAFGLRVAFACVAGLILLAIPLTLIVAKMPGANGR